LQHTPFPLTISPYLSPSLKLDGSFGITLCCRMQQLTRGTFEGGSSSDRAAVVTDSGCDKQQASMFMGSGDEHWW
jgi:hypothetical protein